MGIFLRQHCRRNNGKKHIYWSVVENSRTPAGSVVQRQVLYLGEINSAQQQAWRQVAAQVEPAGPTTPSLFTVAAPPARPPKIDFSGFSLHHSRQWGGC